jgi:hypothetical protein
LNWCISFWLCAFKSIIHVIKIKSCQTPPWLLKIYPYPHLRINQWLLTFYMHAVFPRVISFLSWPSHVTTYVHGLSLFSISSFNVIYVRSYSCDIFSQNIPTNSSLIQFIKHIFIFLIKWEKKRLIKGILTKTRSERAHLTRACAR